MALFTALRHIIFLKEVKGWIFSFGFSPKIVCFSWPTLSTLLPIFDSYISGMLILSYFLSLILLWPQCLTPFVLLFCWYTLMFFIHFYISKTFFETSFIYICACICFALACSHEENVKIFFPLSSSMHSNRILRILNSSIVFCELPILFNLIQTFGFLSCKRQYK